MSKVIYAFLALIALAACETVAGAGQDISTAGDTLTEQAQETENDL